MLTPPVFSLLVQRSYQAIKKTEQNTLKNLGSNLFLSDFLEYRPSVITFYSY